MVDQPFRYLTGHPLSGAKVAIPGITIRVTTYCWPSTWTAPICRNR